MFTRSVSPEQAPDKPTYLEIDFEKGDPVALDGEKLSPATLLAQLNKVRSCTCLRRGLPAGVVLAPQRRPAPCACTCNLPQSCVIILCCKQFRPEKASTGRHVVKTNVRKPQSPDKLAG